MTRVLVTGTDRPIGRATIPRLARYDCIPVAAVGDAAGAVVAIDHDLVADHQIAVDLDTHSSILGALDGFDALIHTADARPGGSESVTESARAMATACADRNVHLVYVSRVGADASSIDHRQQLWKAEQVIEQTNGLAYTLQRITHTHPSVERLMQGPWLPLPAGTPIQPVSPADVAARVVGLVQAGPSERVRDYGGPELLRFADAAHIYKQVRGSVPRKVPLPKMGVIGEAVNGVHVTQTGDRGNETFRTWLSATKRAS